MAAMVDSVDTLTLDLADFAVLARVAAGALAAGFPMGFVEASEVAFLFAFMIESLRGEVKMQGAGLHFLNSLRELWLGLHLAFIRIVYK